MKTTKAYLAGLGMAGMVIGSILVLLAVGTGVVGFDGAPNLGRSKHPLDRVVAGDHGTGRRGGTRQVHDSWTSPGVAATAGGQGFGSRVGGEERGRRPARRRQERRGARSVAARGFGGAESWTRKRLGGGAALGARAAGDGRAGGSAGSPGGRPDTSGGAVARVPPSEPAR
jgi:hypothetical protein